MSDRLRLLERRDIDELIILDIAATPDNRAPRFAELEELTANLFCPTTIGGGVRSVGDIRRLLRVGADKVAIGTAAIENPQFINEAAEKFGSQAVVISIDVKWSGCIFRHRVYSRCGTKETTLGAVDWAKECESRGAGEILLNSIDSDGTMAGYDLDVIGDVAHAVSIPVVACGGCGSYSDMELAMKAGANAVAAGAMFQFREQTPKEAARYLDAHGIPTRT